MTENILRQGILTLIKSAIIGEKLTMPESFDYEKGASLAVLHQITGLFYYGAKNCEAVLSVQTEQKIFTLAAKALLESENQIKEANDIFDIFEREGISYLPLKGVVLKDMYPNADLRSMADIDILIKKEEYPRIVSLISSLGFTPVTESDHEYVWTKSNLLYLELHKYLIPTYNKDYFSYYGEGWRIARPFEGSSRYTLSDEDHYVYIFTHYAKHYRDGGIGIRHLVDLWVFLRKYPSLDFKYIENELEKLQLLQFYKNTRKLISAWFESGEADTLTDLIGGVILDSGVFGKNAQRLAAQAAKKVGERGSLKAAKRRQVRETVLPCFFEMRKQYPILEKLPFLLPFTWVCRGLKFVFFRRDRMRQFAEEIKSISDSAVFDYEAHLTAVGLSYNFESNLPDKTHKKNCKNKAKTKK